MARAPPPPSWSSASPWIGLLMAGSTQVPNQAALKPSAVGAFHQTPLSLMTRIVPTGDPDVLTQPCWAAPRRSINSSPRRCMQLHSSAFSLFACFNGGVGFAIGGWSQQRRPPAVAGNRRLTPGGRKRVCPLYWVDEGNDGLWVCDPWEHLHRGKRYEGGCGRVHTRKAHSARSCHAPLPVPPPTPAPPPRCVARACNPKP
ncbi:MAG: hypothetical protein J3K34DRAFT_421401 [Monoraphidium minutum]|nr:MAG: hypothetical protein J3K34DRAFT_421401 [Monoraphidium minutum]